MKSVFSHSFVICSTANYIAGLFLFNFFAFGLSDMDGAIFHGVKMKTRDERKYGKITFNWILYESNVRQNTFLIVI